MFIKIYINDDSSRDLNKNKKNILNVLKKINIDDIINLRGENIL